MSVFEKKTCMGSYEQGLDQIFSDFTPEEKDEAFCTLTQILFQKGLINIEEIEAIFNWKMIVKEEI